MQWSTDEFTHNASVTSPTPHKTRPHRQRTGRPHDSGAKPAGVVTAGGSPGYLRRKPPVAARPTAAKTTAAAAAGLTPRRKSCPPETLDLPAVHVVQKSQEAAGHRQTLRVDVERQPRTNSQTSASSDIESGSGDSATSGFSSAGSDVIKATGGSDENATATQRRNAKCPKPVVKPKRTSYKCTDDCRF